jgi:hypothetical protein
LSAISIYRGLPSNIYYLAIARMILGMGNFIITFLVSILAAVGFYLMAAKNE